MRVPKISLKKYNYINNIYPTLVINILHRLHRQPSQLHYFIFALKISSDEQSFIAMDTFCCNSLARSAIASIAKRTDRGISEPNNRIIDIEKL